MKIIKVNKYNIWPKKIIEVEIEKNNKLLYMTYDANNDIYRLYNNTILDSIFENENMICISQVLNEDEMKTIINIITKFMEK